MKMKDIDVREAVHKKVLKDHHKNPDTLIIDEFNISLGSARADITVINGILHGYELKSSKDTLERLPGQITHYSSIMDKATLVVAENHMDEAINLLPDWWGVKIVIQGNRGGINFLSHRADKFNPIVNELALAQLLWKEECLCVLDRMGLAKGNRSKPRFELWQILAECTPLRMLKLEVRMALKNRIAWRDQGRAGKCAE